MLTLYINGYRTTFGQEGFVIVISVCLIILYITDMPFYILLMLEWKGLGKRIIGFTVIRTLIFYFVAQFEIKSLATVLIYYKIYAVGSTRIDAYGILKLFAEGNILSSQCVLYLYLPATLIVGIEIY